MNKPLKKKNFESNQGATFATPNKEAAGVGVGRKGFSYIKVKLKQNWSDTSFMIYILIILQNISA